MSENKEPELIPFTKWMGDLSALAAEKIGMPKGLWQAWLFTAREQGGLDITGAVCPPIKKGPRKGKPNVRMRDKSTTHVVYLSKAEVWSIPSPKP